MRPHRLVAGPSQRWLLAVLLLGVLADLAVVNFWPRFPSPNERTRAYQAIAVVTRGSLDIGPELDRFGPMEDVAASGGRTYPNKAPGLLPLLVPAAAAARLLARHDAERELRLTLYLGRWAAASLPFLATAVLLALLAVPRFPRGGPLAVAGWALASPALSSSALLFSHALAAFVVLAAFALLFARERATAPAAALAGLLLGWGVTAEYPVAVPAALLVAVALPRLRLRGAAALAAGGLPPAVVLGLYDRACFGSPFSLSSAHEALPAYASLASRGLFGISWPSLDGLAGLLVSPDRGLLVWAPLLALAAGAFMPGGTGRAGRTRRLAAAVPALGLLLLLAGYPNWDGGWFAGPRYLLAVLPLVALLAAEGGERLLTRGAWQAAAAAAGIWGVVSTWVSLAAFPLSPDHFPVPFATFALPLLADGVHVPSWLPGPALALLLAACTAGAAAVVVRLAASQRSGPPRLAGTLIGVLLVAGATRIPAPAFWRARLMRAVVHDVFAGGPPGELEALRSDCAGDAQCSQVAAWLALRDGPLPWQRPAARPAPSP